jgi:ABC-type branched-subunit amino acid transport system substrate-binding protein
VKTTARRFVVLAAAATLVLAGCGRDDDDGGEDGGAAEGPGVTSEPCPDAVDEEKGCIYLGVITDLTGPFKAVGVPLTEGGKAFWAQVNEDGGIGDYEVNVTEYVKDNQYNPDVHAQAYSEINGEVLAMAQSLGTAATEAMLMDSDAEDLVVLPATLGSNWLFEDRVLEIGSSYCAEAMNAVDYGVDELGSKGVAAIHFPGDYGDDAAVGARIAAEERGVTFTDIPTGPGADQQTAAIAALLKSKADLVVVTTTPVELASIVGGAAAQGFKGKFIGSIPTWNAALLDTPAGPALEAMYLWASSFSGWDGDTPGHEAMRESAGSAAPNEYYALGWTGAYIMKAALEQAVEDDDLSRAGLLEAATSLSGVDGDGMLPEGSGNYAGDPNEAAVRVTQLSKPQKGTGSGAVLEVEPFTGPTAEAFDFQEACYLQK